MEFVLGAAAAGMAVILTNPLEVVKTRFQLQGELQCRGDYRVHYKNIFHAFLVIGSRDGLAALQKGLSAAVLHQFLLNGTRLGLYQMLEERKYVHDRYGKVSFGKSMLAGSAAGAIGGFIGSPAYLVRFRSVL